MQYKYFVGCNNYGEVRSLYKKKAMSLHPDRGGNEEDFKDLGNEYSYITDRDKTGIISYPIKNSYSYSNSNSYDKEAYNDSAVFDGINNFAKAAEQARRREKEAEEKRRREEAKKARRTKSKSDREEQIRKEQQEQDRRREEYWSIKFDTDVNYEILDGLVTETILMNQSSIWVAMEMNKLKDLGIDHFHFVRYKMNKLNQRYKLNENWVFESYSKYITLKDLEWEDL